jgi:hypothetical protein
MPRPIRVSRLLALAAALALAPPLASQAVVGKLVEEGSRAPVAAVLVSLVDSAGRAVATAQTSADGGFMLAAPAAGTYRVRAERGGRAAVESEALALAPGAPHALEIVTARAAGGGVVTGFVRDGASGSVVAGARVYLVGDLVSRAGTAYEALTGEDGGFRLEGVPAGRHVVSYEHPMGLETVPVEVEVNEGGESPVELALSLPPEAAAAVAGAATGSVAAASAARDSAITLAPLAVMAEVTRRRLAAYGFYERKRVSSGAFLTTEDFVKRSGARLIDRIQGLRGTYVRPSGRDGWMMYQHQRGVRCFVTLWINGRPGTLREIEHIQADNVEAIEVYSAEDVPLRFAAVNRGGGRAPCGSVVIWLKSAI